MNSTSIFKLVIAGVMLGRPVAHAGGPAYVDTPYLIDVPVESRSISFENPTGGKGMGGMAASQIGVGRKGSPLREVGAGETVTLCDIQGPGVIRRIWMTVFSSPENLLGFVIRGYWDGQEHPSIEAPLGSFFGCAHGISAPYQSAVHEVNSQAGLSIYVPMPFARRARFTVTNEGPGGKDHLYYQMDYTLGDVLPETFGRLHVLYRRENPTTLGRDFEILPRRRGAGRFLGCVLGTRILEPDWFGEGEVKFYLDGDEEFPTLCGTGTEDYVGQSWGFQDAAYRYGGTPLRRDDLRTFYRWHLKDPVYWKKDIRVTIQQIGASAERGYFDRRDDWATATFWFESVPSDPLPRMPDYPSRTVGLVDGTRTADQPSAGPAPALVTAGDFEKIYDPSVGEDRAWYINDHCFVYGPDRRWHLFGITHPEPAAPIDEDDFAHARAESLVDHPWEKRPPALTVDERFDEIHLWAPHVVAHDGQYHMFYCAGDQDNRRYKIHLATSRDLITWTRHHENPVVVDGYDARDPYVLRDDDRWIMYYTATSKPEGGHHIVACRTSTNLVQWSERRTVFTDPSTGTWGGPTESPTVIRRGGLYYLFIGPREGYRGTAVYRSEDPFHWNQEQQVGFLDAHAAEVIRDLDGKWYVSHCGWGQGGVYLAPLHFHDRVPDANTSLPVPR